jgi:hypothetical protein
MSSPNQNIDENAISSKKRTLQPTDKNENPKKIKQSILEIPVISDSLEKGIIFS